MKKSMQLKKDTNLLLLIDKQGDIGKALVAKLREERDSFSIVFATSEFSQNTTEDIFFFPYKHNIPVFPDGFYSHIVIVYNGEKEVFSSLSGFAKKADDVAAKLIVVLPIAFCKKDIFEHAQKLAPDASIVVVGDIFGENLLVKKTTIGKFMQTAKEEERIVVSGMGLSATYPVLVVDTAAAIIKVMLSNKKKHGVFFAFAKYPATKLSLARMLQKIEPLIRIDFVGKEEAEDIFLPQEGEYLLESYLLEQKVRSVFESQTEREFLLGEEAPFIEEAVPRRKTSFFVWQFFLFFAVFFLLPFAATGIYMLVGLYNVTEAKRVVVQKGNIPLSRAYAQSALSALHIAEKTLRAAVFETSFLGKNTGASWLERNIDLEKASATLMLEAVQAADAWQKEDGVVFVSSARASISLLQAIRLEKGSAKFLLPSTQLFSSILGVAEDIAGFQTKKTYLVLFQNNMELRPGGGFIGSYGIAHVDLGNVAFSLHDVYDADGQLKGHVEPPFAIRRHLPSVHWYMRDSNFSPDFPTDASASAFFLQQETGEKIDGVIAVDVSFVKMLVSAFGSIEIPEYKETLTKDNFYEVVQKHSEENFFPGSTQKKDFLASLFRAMQVRLGQKNIPYQLLYQVVLDGIAQKHVILSFSNKAVQRAFTVNNMSSSLWQESSSARQNQVHDFLGISEANLGVNKVNNNITRTVSQDMTFSKEGTVSGKLTIVYKNTSIRDDYKNYLRVILPIGAQVHKIIVGNEEQKIVPAVTDPTIYEAKKFVPPQGLEVTEEDKNGKLLVGFLLVVPKQGQEIVAILYSLPDKILFSNSTISYDMQYFKQPGTDTYPYSLSLSYPDTIAPVIISKDLQKKDGKLLLQTTLLGDITLAATFGQK